MDRLLIKVPGMICWNCGQCIPEKCFFASIDLYKKMREDCITHLYYYRHVEGCNKLNEISDIIPLFQIITNGIDLLYHPLFLNCVTLFNDELDIDVFNLLTKLNNHFQLAEHKLNIIIDYLETNKPVWYNNGVCDFTDMPDWFKNVGMHKSIMLTLRAGYIIYDNLELLENNLYEIIFARIRKLLYYGKFEKYNTGCYNVTLGQYAINILVDPDYNECWDTIEKCKLLINIEPQKCAYTCRLGSLINFIKKLLTNADIIPYF